MNNNKQILIAGSVGLVLILGVLAYFALLKPKTSEPQMSDKSNQITVSPEPVQNGNTASKGSLLDLVKLGGTIKCSFSSTDEEGGKTEGTSYISGKNVRADLEMPIADGQTIKSHMITDGEWVYAWNSSTPQGFKMKVDQEADVVDKAADTPSGKVLNDEFDYTCLPWIVDNAMFEIPTDIEFTDFSGMMENPAIKDGCTACSYIQDEEGKTACLQRLNCE